MTLEELIAKRKELLAQVADADAEMFAKIQEEIKKVDYQIEETEKQEENERKAAAVDAEKRAARKANPSVDGAKDNVTLFRSAEGAEDKELTKEQALRFAKVAFGKQVRAKLMDLKVDLSKNEKRALGIAVTTSATNYVAPTESVDGVNNGGIFIPQNVLYDLLELDQVDSPFLRDVMPTHIKGATIFPYVIESSNGSTKGKKETVAETTVLSNGVNLLLHKVITHLQSKLQWNF